MKQGGKVQRMPWRLPSRHRKSHKAAVNRACKNYFHPEARYLPDFSSRCARHVQHGEQGTVRDVVPAEVEIVHPRDEVGQYHDQQRGARGNSAAYTGSVGIRR